MGGREREIESAMENIPALQDTGGSFCRSFNSLVMRFEAIAVQPNGQFKTNFRFINSKTELKKYCKSIIYAFHSDTTYPSISEQN